MAFDGQWLLTNLQRRHAVDANITIVVEAEAAIYRQTVLAVDVLHNSNSFMMPVSGFALTEVHSARSFATTVTEPYCPWLWRIYDSFALTLVMKLLYQFH